MVSPSLSRRPVLVATLLGLVARLAAAVLFPIAVTEDAAEYHGLAARLSSGQGYVTPDGRPTAFRPPGLPLLLALAYRAAGPDPGAGRLALALVGTLAIPLAAAFAGRLGGERAAAVTALGAALYPPFVASWYSPRALLSDVLLTTLALAALWLAVRSHEEAASAASGAQRRPAAVASLPLALAAGVAAGAAMLTKGTAVCLLPLLVAFTIASCWSRTAGAPSLRAGGLRALFMLVAAAAIVGPWLVRNQRVFGAWVPVSTNGGISIWASYNPQSRGLGNAEEGYAAAVAEAEQLRRDEGLDEVALSRHFLRKAEAEIRARPERALRLVARKGLLLVDPSQRDWSCADPPLVYNWAYGAMLPFALLGALLALRRPASRSLALLLLGFVFCYGALHVLLHTDVRYRVVVEPALLALAGLAIVVAWQRLGTRRSLPLLVAYALVHALIAWRYAAVFEGLSWLTRRLGLG